VSDTTDATTIQVAARAFITAAFRSLADNDVIPASRFRPYLAVGRDYEGAGIMPLPEFEAFESLLMATYPDRFDEPLEGPDPEFASQYIFSFLEASISRIVRQHELYEADSPSVASSIVELLSVLDADSQCLTYCRAVSHLTTEHGAILELGDIAIVPGTAEPDDGLFAHAVRLIPGAYGAFNNRDPRPYDPPFSLVITQGSFTAKPHDLADRLRGRVDRFLLTARLLHSGTFRSYWEVVGAPTLVSRISPYSNVLGRGSMAGVRRTTRLSPSDADAIRGLGELIEQAQVKRDGMVDTSFDMALRRFHAVNTPQNDLDLLVDFATAMEGLLAGQETETEAVTLRLRNRAAALLATESDPASTIFKDIGILYGLRSKTVHGGNLSVKTLLGEVKKVSTTPQDTMFGPTVAFTVERMRDLVRRAILARLGLASQPDPLWPLSGALPDGTSVDAELTDDHKRVLWRARWHERLAERGAASAAEAARPAVDVISQDDR
jgi:hypothetical protein